VDTVCGIGLPELIILALVGFVVIGPDRSRDMALSTGRFLRKVMKSPWWREFNQVTSALRDLPTTLVRMAELEDTLRSVRTDLDRASHIDFNQTMGTPSVDSSTPVVDPARDPWGIATQPPPAPSTPLTTGEDSNPDGDGLVGDG
jgi:Sec-independent protein translocase protein TatA